jgi:spoIIIJ-associated protein
LKENRSVSTYSVGDEPRRYVVIASRRRRRRRDYDRENYGEE